jgi:hypothetical protein
MYRNIVLLILFAISKPAFSQINPLEIINIHKTKASYNSYEVVGNRLFAITDSGQVVVWDLTKHDTVHFAHNSPLVHYTAIGKDRKGQIFLGTDKGYLYKIDPADLAYTMFLRVKYPVKYICFNSNNKMFLIIPYAVYDPINKKRWKNFKMVAGGLSAMEKAWNAPKLSIPHFVFFDSEDRWWMCSNYGEFGSEIQIFDAKGEKEYNNKIDSLQSGLLFPKSIFNDAKGNTYITSGLQHMMNFGEIYKITPGNIVSKIFDGKNLNKKDAGLADGIGVFVGPGVYNPKDGDVYFATQNGIYKAELPETGVLKNFISLFNPKLTWNREPLAIGAQMSYVSLRFTEDQKLIIQTANDGFGIYDGRHLTFLK